MARRESHPRDVGAGNRCSARQESHLADVLAGNRCAVRQESTGADAGGPPRATRSLRRLRLWLAAAVAAAQAHGVGPRVEAFGDRFGGRQGGEPGGTGEDFEHRTRLGRRQVHQR